MIGLILWREPQPGLRQKRVEIQEVQILTMRFLRAEVLRGPRARQLTLRRRMLAAARALRRCGVTQAVLPEGFQDAGVLERCGLRPVSTLALRRSIAADWVSAELAAWGKTKSETRVAIAAEELTGEVVRTVTELALRYRYVLVQLGHGGEALSRQLRQEYGISLLMQPSAEQVEGAEAMVLFQPRPEWRCRNPVVLSLYGEGELPCIVLPPALEAQLPKGADRGQLLAALRNAGVLKPGQLTIKVMRSGGKDPKNGSFPPDNA